MKHGTSIAYGQRGCRCEPCRGWKRDNQKAWRARTGDVANKRLMAQRRAAGKAYMNSLKTECVKCGATDQLEFDHINPEAKRYKVSTMYGFPTSAIDEEISKCQVLCKPCHIEKTRANGEYNKVRTI